MNYKLIFKFAMLAGEIMLRNGAETYRVEDTINRILQTTNFQVIESFVTPTGIFATLDDPSITMITFVKRVNKRTIHLSKVELINDISRKYCANKLTIDESYEQLLEVQKKPSYPNWIMIIAYGLAAGFFTLVFNGDIYDCIVSTIIGSILGILDIIFKKLNIYKFFYDIVGGVIIALIAIIFTKAFNFGTNIDNIIIGSIMPLVPGVAFTNAIRDTIEGNLLSGVSRAVEALIIAASIATGVGVMLKFYMLYGGNAI
ncbi:MAG: threonine/serine exporter family protein [Vallitalea sp.]|jgi:uncharacterized membrane protein YjjP (DUF1212 family)|nr:threonine/serine exporter family protein [Vallitalea sp.]